MPNIDPKAITRFNFLHERRKCDIGTLASSFSSDEEIADENNVKVAVKEKLDNNQFGKASDFFRTDVKNTKFSIIMSVFMPLLIKL